MKLLSALSPFLLLLTAAGTAVAENDDDGGGGHHHHHHKGNGTVSRDSQCGELARLTRLTDLANNATRLDKVTKGNATRADEIRSQASAAAPTLQALQANTTLAGACERVFAVRATERDCRRLASMERLQRVVANETLLDARARNNATWAAELRAKATADAAGPLPTLQGNATLTAFCAAGRTKEDCREVRHLRKEVETAQNATALADRFKGNATRVAEFQARASKAAVRLEALQGNSSLTDACAALACKSLPNTNPHTHTRI